jgi:molybdopterin biosynthesis enzyme
MTAGGKQKIRQLMPFDKAVSALEGLAGPVAPRTMDVNEALGRTLASPILAAASPARPIALQVGWAEKADELTDAGGYSSVQLARAPQSLEVGDELPVGTDAVAPPDAIVMRGGVVEAVSPVVSGEGVLLIGGDIDPSKPLRKAGERVRAIDAAVFTAARVAQVNVRMPRILIATAREDLRLVPVAQVISRDCHARGGDALARNGLDLDDALRADDCDAIVVIGGSGMGPRDRSVEALAAHGTVVAHGVGIAPGETAAYGFVGTRPVLIVPGRLDAALAIWLTLGRHLLALLAGSRESEPTSDLVLLRKVTSTIGLAEVVPVRRDNMHAEPLASKNLPLWALTQANGWLLVPPDSEGYPAGARVAINNWL